MKVQLADGVIAFLEEKGFTCDINDSKENIELSQKELLLHYFPHKKDNYENLINTYLKAKNLDEKEGTVYMSEKKMETYEPLFREKVKILTDSLRNFIVSFTSLEPNKSYPSEDVDGYKWIYDNFQCEILSDGYSFLSIDINDRMNEIDKRTYETTSQDQCILLLKKLYEDYVLYDAIYETKKVEPFEKVVDDFFTENAKQKLIDAYDYELEPGEVQYALWILRTSAQDSGDKDVAEYGIKEILPLGENKYVVNFFDEGFETKAEFTFAEEKGKLKIDDFKVDDKTYEIGR